MNPTSPELIVLKDVEKLNEDVDHVDNLIPLCTTCHTKFDKPRSREEYEKLVKIKKEFITKTSQKDLWASFNLDEEILRIVDSLYEQSNDSEVVDLSYDPLEIDRKVNSTLDALTKRKIKYNVTSYFPLIKTKLKELDMERDRAGELISGQIKNFYLKQQKITKDQQEIYVGMVEWIMKKTKTSSNESAEIIIAFFIQNCEVFG